MKLIKEKIGYLPPATYSVTGEDEENRNQLALRGQDITSITTAEENQIAGQTAIEVRKYIKAVEEARVLLTQPLLAGQRLLKKLADEHVGPLQNELKRIEKLADDFAQSERRRVEAEERKRMEEFHRLERERLAAEEKARKALESAKTEKQKAEAAKLQKAADKLETKVQTAIAVPEPAVARVSGQTTKKVLKWEVTDIYALAKARPDLVRMEPNAAGIQSTCIPEMPNKPEGLKLWWENQTRFTTR